MTKKDEKQGTTDVAVVEEAGVPAELNDLFDLKENMEGVEARLPQIGIIHQAQMYEMPDEEKVKSFTGIILDVSRTNAWWSQSFDEAGGGNPPDCFSLNGITSDGSSNNRQSVSCNECPQNQFGSDGRGKSCKNMKRIHIALEGELLPLRLTIPPSNLKAVDLYISLLTSKGTPYQLVTTSFALKTASNKDGIKYAELVLTPIGRITDREEAYQVKQLRDQWLPIMRGQAVTGNEAAPF